MIFYSYKKDAAVGMVTAIYTRKSEVFKHPLRISYPIKYKYVHNAKILPCKS